jgi:hypothetical protein
MLPPLLPPVAITENPLQSTFGISDSIVEFVFCGTSERNVLTLRGKNNWEAKKKKIIHGRT